MTKGGAAIARAATAALLLLWGSPGCRLPVAPGTTMANGAPDAGATPGPRSESLSILIDGSTRHLIVHLPGGVGVGDGTTGTGTPPRPLVLNLHGSGGTAAQQQAFCAMDALADANGFIVAYPDAAIALSGGFAWNVPGQPLLGGGAVPVGAADDVAFFAQVIPELERRYPIDAHRVFVTGMSGGARMASQLGCNLSTTIAAIAPVAGLRFPGPCGPRPVPVVSFHGTADATNPYDGGGEAYWTYSVPSAAQQWAAQDGCNATPAVSPAAVNVELTAYGECAGGAAVALYTIAGAGHEWPGAPGQTAAIDAGATMWTFFAAHPLP